MADKPVVWQGSSLADLKDPKIFTASARDEVGRQLRQVQRGLDPAHWKPFPEVGAGVKEIIVNEADGWYRTFYLAKFPEAIYVLHCFKKKNECHVKSQ